MICNSKSLVIISRHDNGPQVGTAKKPTKGINRKDQRARIREEKIESINNELSKPSLEVIQLKRDRKASNTATATLKLACDLEARNQVCKSVDHVHPLNFHVNLTVLMKSPTGS